MPIKKEKNIMNEIIDSAEFMRRMKIKSTTFYGWKSSGRLIRTKHYVQAGAIIRIFWCEDLIRELDDL